MVRYEFVFSIDKNIKTEYIIGADLEDCWNKLLNHYRNAKKSPVLIKKTLVEEWKIGYYNIDGSQYEKECDELLAKVKFDKKGFEII